MRNYLLSSVLALSFLLSAIGSKAMPCHWFCKDSASAGSKHRDTHTFLNLSYGITSLNTSTSLNNWLLRENCYVHNNFNESILGLNEVIFKGKWICEYSIMTLQNLSPTNTPGIQNETFGVGYNFLTTNFFSAYGALDLGLSSFFFEPGQSASGDLGQYNQPSGSVFIQNSLLVNPHLLLYRNITNNLTGRPGRVSAIGAGIDAGFNLSVWQSGWKYGYSNSQPFTSVKVQGMPSSAWGGFYIMGKIGWYFGRE